MSNVKVIHNPQYDTDWAVGYEDGKAVVLADMPQAETEEWDGLDHGATAIAEEGYSFYNRGENRTWQVVNGKWCCYEGKHGNGAPADDLDW